MTNAVLLLTLLAGASVQDKPGLTPPGLTPPGQAQTPRMALKAVRPEKTAVVAGETFKVSFDLVVPPGWYTYPTYKKGIGSPTKFVFEGADVAGEIEEPKAKTKAGTDIIPEYDYHVGAVTMTVPVRLRSVTPSGKVALKGHVDYQICNPQTCVPGKLPFSIDLDVSEPEDDAPPPLKVISVTPSKAEAKVGETFEVGFEVEIPRPWHIYPTYKTTTGLVTDFKFPGLDRAGEIKEPEAKDHPAGEIQPAYKYHEGKVTFTVPFALKAGAVPGELDLKGRVEYMICEFEGICVPADVPASFKLVVLEGTVTPQAAPTAAGADKSFLGMLGLAFVGGLLLNIMPCVLPVLLLKLMSLVKQKDITTAGRHAAAISYSAGVLICLNAFALVVVILGALGRQVGWGFQFQEPGFVIALATLIFVFALSLLGVFEVPAFGTGAAAQAGQKKGWAGHLGTGLFVTLVATPCSAPFLGTGLGFAFTLPAWGIFLFFSAAGLGLAFPFLIIGFFPALFKLLPKPGAWLEVFKKAMGFALLATTVWLIDTVATLTGQEGVIGYLAFLTFVAVGCWIFGTWGTTVSSGRSKLISVVAAVALAFVGGRMFLVTEIAQADDRKGEFRMTDLEWSEKIPWQPFSDENVDKLRKAGKPGFIDFTADW